MAVAVDLSHHEPSFAPSVAFSCDAKLLRAAVCRIVKSTDARSTLPVLSQLKISASAGAIVIAATDLDVDVRVTLSAEVMGSGCVLAPGVQLADSLRSARGPVSVSQSGSAVHVRTTNAGWFVLPAGEPNDYPSLSTPPDRVDATLRASDLARMLSCVIHAIGVDETRPHLCGALFQRERDVLHAVAVDGHRLATSTCFASGVDFTALVHRRGIEEAHRWLQHIDGPVSIRRIDSRAFFIADGLVISGRLIDAAFPAWRDVIPQHSDARFTVDRAELLSALRAIKMRRQNSVKLDFDRVAGGIVVSTSDGEHEAAVELRATCRGSLPSHLGLSHRYLSDLASAVDEPNITMDVAGELDPVHVATSAGDVFVLMPLRIG